MTATRQAIRPVLALLATVVLALAACDGSDPGAPGAPAALSVSYSFVGELDQTATDALARAFDKADNVRIVVEIPGRDPIVEILDIRPGQSVVRARVEVPLEGSTQSAVVRVELRAGSSVLFSGSTTVVLGSDEVRQIEIGLVPAAGGISLGAPWTIEELGARVQLDGSVVFATGDELPGRTLTWSTNATGIDVTPGGVVTAHANGTYEVTATSGELVAAGQVLVDAEATVTSVSPDPVLLGRPVTLQIGGRNLQGATAVTACGTATVDDNSLSVASDGRTVGVTVEWAFLDAATDAVQVGARCVRVETPQGTAEGSANLAQPDAASVEVTPTAAGLAPGQTVQLSAVARDDLGNELVDPAFSFESDDEGVASVDGDGLVTAHAPGQATVTVSSGTASATAEISVGGGTIEGHVTLDEEPLEAITVELSGPGGARATSTDASGAYAFANLAPGEYTVSLADIPATATFTPQSKPATVVSDETVVVDFAGTPAPGTISGTVTVDGEPVEGETVTLSSEGFTAATTTDAGGRYEFTDLAAGTYSVSVEPGGDVAYQPQQHTVTLAPGEGVVLDFEGATGSGTVQGTVTADGDPVQGASVTLRPPASLGSTEQPSLVTPPVTVQTSSLGVYTIEDVPVGTWELELSGAPGAFPFTVTSVVVHPNETTVVDFTGTTAATVEGVVVVDGSPASGLTVELTGSQNLSSVTGPDGSFGFAGVDPGSWTVSVYDPGVTFFASVVNITATAGQTKVVDFVGSTDGPIDIEVHVGAEASSGVVIPLDDVDVTLVPTGYESAATMTTAGGVAYFGSVPDVPYDAFFDGVPTWATLPPSPTSVSGSAPRIVEYLGISTATGSISGDVTVDGAGQSAVVVQLFDSDFVTLYGETGTNGSGHYTFANLPTGAYGLKLPTLPPGASGSDQESTSVSSGSTATVDFPLTTGGGTGDLTGTVTVDGFGEDNIQVTADDGVTTPIVTQTDVNGEYQLLGIAATSYTVNIDNFSPLHEFPSLQQNAAVPAGGSAVADFSGSSWTPELVFEGTPNTADEVFAANTFGNGPGQLTSNPEYDLDPRPSPTGAEILFVRQSTDPGLGTIMKMNRDGSGQTVLATSGTFDYRHPRWEPAGSGEFAYITDVAGTDQVFLSGGGGQLTSGAAVTGFVWSPDGSQIAYVAGGDIWVVDADGLNATQLTTDVATDDQPTWSPDGTQIAFRTDRNGNGDVYLVPASGFSGATALNTDPQDDNTPAWSPDGTSIAVSRSDSGDWLYLLDAGNGTATNVTFDTQAYDPVWEPGGSRIAFSGWDGDFEIFVVGSSGTNLIQVTDNGDPDLRPTWFQPS